MARNSLILFTALMLFVFIASFSSSINIGSGWCGDLIVDFDEECDGGEGCSADCTFITSSCSSGCFDINNVCLASCPDSCPSRCYSVFGYCLETCPGDSGICESGETYDPIEDICSSCNALTGECNNTCSRYLPCLGGKSFNSDCVCVCPWGLFPNKYGECTDYKPYCKGGCSYPLSFDSMCNCVCPHGQIKNEQGYCVSKYRHGSCVGDGCNSEFNCHKIFPSGCSGGKLFDESCNCVCPTALPVEDDNGNCVNYTREVNISEEEEEKMPLDYEIMVYLDPEYVSDTKSFREFQQSRITPFDDIICEFRITPESYKSITGLDTPNEVYSGEMYAGENFETSILHKSFEYIGLIDKMYVYQMRVDGWDYDGSNNGIGRPVGWSSDLSIINALTSSNSARCTFLFSEAARYNADSSVGGVWRQELSHYLPIVGDGKYNFLFQYGESSSTSPELSISKSISDFNSLLAYSPFKEHSDKFGASINLKELEDASVSGEEFYSLPLNSDDGDVPSSSYFKVLTFYHGKTDIPTGVTIKNSIYLESSVTSDRFVHQVGHAFATLNDEYYDSVDASSSNSLYDSFSMKNCISPLNWGFYGGDSFFSCIFGENFNRPSESSIMSNSYSVEDKFNTVSCGYILKEMELCSDIESCWGMCQSLNGPQSNDTECQETGENEKICSADGHESIFVYSLAGSSSILVDNPYKLRGSKDLSCKFVLTYDDMEKGIDEKVDVTFKELRIYNYFGTEIARKDLKSEKETITKGDNYTKVFKSDYSFSRGVGEEDGLALVCIVDYLAEFKEDGGVERCPMKSSNPEWFGDWDNDTFWSFDRMQNLNCSKDGEVVFVPSEKYGVDFDHDDWLYDDDSEIRGIDKDCAEGFKSYDQVDRENSTKLNDFCYEDTNNDGLGDYAMCAFCKNPDMSEEADDIDNDGKGHCQGDSTIECSLDEEYTGDGATGSSECEAVINDWGVEDDFCQMVDDNVRTSSGETCGGYNRAVKWGYEEITDLNSFTENKNSDICIDLGESCSGQAQKVLVFKPGGVKLATLDFSSEFYNDLRLSSALIGYYNFIAREPRDDSKKKGFISFSDFVSDGTNSLNFNVAESNYYYLTKFLSAENNEGKDQTTRKTVGLPEQYIDSFRGEFNKDIGESGKSMFDWFWEVEVVSEGKDKLSDDFEWYTSCVSKDKCTDGADNNGPRDLLSVAPFSEMYKSIVSYKYGDSEYSADKQIPLLMEIVDVDESSCKFTDNGEAFRAAYGLAIDASMYAENFPSMEERKISKRLYNGDLFKGYSSETGINAYCNDDDGDGFCGCPLSLSNECDEQYGFENYGQVASKQFPDCVDSDLFSGFDLFSGEAMPTSNYVFDNDKFVANAATGFGRLDEKIVPWHIHPFAPVTDITCTLGDKSYDASQNSVRIGTDINCNKGGKAGADLSALQVGGTPFDNDLNTGIEYIEINSRQANLAGEYLGSSDSVCILPDPNEGFNAMNEFIVKVYVSYLLGAVSVPLDTAVTAYFAHASVTDITADFKKWQSGSMTGAEFTFSSAANAFALAMMGNSVRINMMGGVSRKMAIDEDISDFNRALGALAKTNPAKKVTNLNVKIRFIEPKKYSIVPKTHESVAEAMSDLATAKTPGCFLENTSVNLANGSLIDIEDLKVGMSVVAFDLELNKSTVANITTTFIRNETKYRIIEYG